MDFYKVFTDSTRSKTRHIFCLQFQQTCHWTDAMRSVVHRRKPRPIVGPAFHILLVRGFQKLYFSKFVFFIKFFSFSPISRSKNANAAIAPCVPRKPDAWAAARPMAAVIFCSSSCSNRPSATAAPAFSAHCSLTATAVSLLFRRKQRRKF